MEVIQAQKWQARGPRSRGPFCLPIAELIDNLRGDSQMPLKRRLRCMPSCAANAVEWTA